MIGVLAVDGWAVTFGTARRGLGGLRPRPGPVTHVHTEQSRALQSFNVIEIGTNRIESPYVIFC